MAAKSNVQCYTIRLLPGQDLKDEIEAFVEKKNLEAAFIMTCVGSINGGTLRFPIPKTGPVPAANRELTYRKEYFDILSLVGSVSQGGSHLHVVLGRADGTVVGGHLVGNAKVHTTAEVVIGESLSEVYVRKNDPNTSFNELEVVTFDENLEICSLVGTLARDGSHLHTVLGRADGSVVAGHVVGDMVVQTTAEVVLGDSTAEQYSREYDPATSYNELVVSKRQ